MSSKNYNFKYKIIFDEVDRIKKEFEYIHYHIDDLDYQISNIEEIPDVKNIEHTTVNSTPTIFTTT